MRRKVTLGLIGLALMLMSARPAAAQYSWLKWIQELSGPGPFHLHGFTATFGCIGEDGRSIFTAKDGIPLVYKGLGCDRIATRWKDVAWFGGITVARGSGKNNLEPATDTPVSALMVRFAVTRRLDEVWDVGSGIGLLRFSAVKDSSTAKFFLEPFVSIRPWGYLVLKSDSKFADFLARVVDVTFGAIIFPEGFRPSDFGAVSGANLTGKPEVSWNVAFRFVFF
jgi:hypothetical protein